MNTQLDDLKKDRKKYVLFILEEKLKQAPNYDSIKHAQVRVLLIKPKQKLITNKSNFL